MAAAEFLFGKAVSPADVIPVVNLESERNDLIGLVAARRETADPLIGGRSTATAFRGVKLQHGGGFVAALSAALAGCESVRGNQ